MKWIFVTFLLVSLSVLNWSCSDNSKTAGVGGQTTNGISGTINSENGPVQGAVVSLYVDNYNPLDSTGTNNVIVDTTDEFGNFSFNNILPDVYNIYAVNSADSTAALLTQLNYQQPIDSLEVRLDKPGEIKLHLDSLDVQEGEYLYIPGTVLFVKLDSMEINQGVILLDNIPSGSYPSILLVKEGGGMGLDIIDEVIIVLPNQSVEIGPYNDWGDTSEIIINTSVTGANISNPLVNYPLLLRLNDSSTILNMSEVSSKEIRFSKSDGVTSLSYEIEVWDSVQAVIWVKMDTIFPNRDSQNIYMYSGNTSVSSLSSSGDVFNRDNHFISVWHLGEDGNNQINGYKDAGQENHRGTAKNMTSNSDSVGVIDNSQKFIGDSNFIMVRDDSVYSLKTFTLSAWINIEQINARQNIVAQWGDVGAGNGAWRLSISKDRYLLIGNHDSLVTSILIDSTTQIELKEWTYVSGVYEGGTSGENSKLFVNGNLIYSGTLISEPQDSELFVGIGGLQHMGVNEYFQGRIDEVRISSKAQSSDWIKFDYESQKIGSRVVTIK